MLKETNKDVADGLAELQSGGGKGRLGGINDDDTDFVLGDETGFTQGGTSGNEDIEDLQLGRTCADDKGQ